MFPCSASFQAYSENFLLILNFRKISDVLVQSPDAWAILGHQKYLTGDVQEAKTCYERTLSFIDDASEMHSIYLRLASIYLQQGQVGQLTH